MHVLRGKRRGRDVVMFEYSYRESSSSVGTDGYWTTTTKTPTFTVVAVVTPAARPWLQVSRLTAGRRILARIGTRDLQLEDEEFNRVFRIQTGADRFAYDVLHPRMMAWLLDHPARRATQFRFEQAFLLTWEAGRIDVARALAFADHLTTILDQVPRFVWDDAPQGDAR